MGAKESKQFPISYEEAVRRGKSRFFCTFVLLFSLCPSLSLHWDIKGYKDFFRPKFEWFLNNFDISDVYINSDRWRKA